ncbi:unnamed protein product (macronuclear) [Paramecium tetraurelia]|uniref:Uncharacterized protein n=1 Tax=Paramecium tetraurelia TaxID=5888 RepID=A0CLL4_PARTE|nr:uncharacterized protein GSPATT00008230001 [Paramecium tetraurelia]CAK71681.1 unnamed protein product [Paramecium tetraurelia]|eukprot:XP_001439078.1 hypothetical protein (macronuclear) [Paramecium tetraurelia strain d4-2]
MGNDALSSCTKKQKSSLVQRESNITISRQFNSTMCSILQGDIYCQWIEYSKFVHMNLQILQSLKHLEISILIIDRVMRSEQVYSMFDLVHVGDVILTERQNLFLLHAKLPMYSEIKDLQKVYSTYEKCLEIADENILSEITFTEQNALNFAIPKQYNAECLIRCIINYISLNPQTNLKQINFLSNDYTTINIFKLELDNILEEMKVPNLAEKNRKIFFEFLNSTNCEEAPYFLSTGLTTSFAHLTEKSAE